jgi:hypothetical protein
MAWRCFGELVEFSGVLRERGQLCGGASQRSRHVDQVAWASAGAEQGFAERDLSNGDDVRRY